MCFGPSLAEAQIAAPDSVVYVISSASTLDVKTGTAGLLGFAGHEHVVRARDLSGRVVYFPNAPTASRVDVTILAGGLEVLTPPDTAEIRQVMQAMRTAVLDVAHHPEITFVSRAVAVTEKGVRVAGMLTLVGHTRDASMDVTLDVHADTLRATATFAIRQTAFGIVPYKGGPGGTVRVADLVRCEIHAVAVRQAGRLSR